MTLGLCITVALVGWIAVPAVIATNVPRPEIGARPASRGLEYKSLILRTRDDVRLAAWYLPSRNGAAVVLLHGAGSTRSDVLDQAVVLNRHGYGVLLLDARGHGESSGRAMDFGWFGDRDIEAATRFLTHRPEVAPNRIGAVGLSMGGEEAIGAAATNRSLRAVVAEGATGRVASDQAWLSDQYGLRGALQEQLTAARDDLTDLLTTASPPISLREAVARARGTKFLLITAGRVADEVNAARHVASAAPARVARWNVPDADHTKGLATRPRQWEQRVIDFLDDTLRLRDVAGHGNSEP